MKIKELKLVSSASGITDVRYYLNGIYITNHSLTGSDGHRLAYIETDTSLPEGVDSIIVPIESVKQFLKSFKKSQLNNPFVIERFDEQFILTDGNVRVIFKGIEGQYPKFDKYLEIINEELDEIQLQFNWKYVYEADKAIQEYTNSKYSFIFHQIIKDTWKLGYFKEENVSYIIMPMYII